MTRRPKQPDRRVIARLQRWYAWSVSGRWSIREVIHAWTLRVPPNVWNLGWPATEAEVARYPGRYLLPSDGSAWGPHDLALARADLAARLAVIRGRGPIEIGTGGFSFDPPIDELVRCGWVFAAYRATERHHLTPRSDDSADAALARLAAAMGVETIRLTSTHVGLRKDLSAQTGGRYQKRVGTARLSRALLIWGLVEAGLSRRAAIRRWLDWEIALDGPLARSTRVRDAARLATSGTDRDALREYEDSVRGATRQAWLALGIDR